MGDMADMLIEQGMEQWLDDNADGMGHEPNPPAFITCRYCKTRGLEWGDLDGKWRLFTGKGELHACKVNSLPALPAPPKPRVVTDPVEKAFRAGHDAGWRAAMQEAFPDVGVSMGVSVGEAYLGYLKTSPPKPYEPSIGEGVADGV